MFNFFKKTKKTAKSKTKIKKAVASLKKSSTSSQKSQKSPDQNMNLAAEKLESTIRNLNARGTANYQPPPADKQKLINQAIAIQKTQSKLLPHRPGLLAAVNLKALRAFKEMAVPEIINTLKTKIMLVRHFRRKFF